ncbi:hypothetical protein SAY87_006392 [Trapa incisa]|uniref:Uncharacterized protein n=1 Tax=Trapa incisa TaxID=236973 RepID=A0AAN7K271_9MYRT|nr:hypothetical protein SAY87_006392 [Trapa incisa]
MSAKMLMNVRTNALFPRGFHGDDKRGGERCISYGTCDNMLPTKTTLACNPLNAFPSSVYTT